MTNYANWFAYYRTRIQAVKTVTSSCSGTSSKYRVGFHKMFQLSSFLNIADFDRRRRSRRGTRFSASISRSVSRRLR